MVCNSAGACVPCNGGVALVFHCARLCQRLGEARARLVILVSTPIGHAQLDQCVTRFGAVAVSARRRHDALNIGNGALRLSGLRTCRTAMRVNGETLRRSQ